jgi:hypothetical protein
MANSLGHSFGRKLALRDDDFYQLFGVDLHSQGAVRDRVVRLFSSND